MAPTVRDGQVTREILTRAGLDCAVAHDLNALEQRLEGGLGALVLTDITLAQAASDRLLALIEEQPAWSNLPVLALCRDGMQSPAIVHALRTLRNVTVLDRPVSSKALVSAAQAALRGRRWQYQIRDQIDKLLHAELELRQADQRKDEFIATLAHELRNPLAPIKTGLAILERSAADATVVKSTHEMMGRQLTHLVRLIDELLEVSRISTGKVVLQPAWLDMRELVATALESCAPLIAMARHQVTVKLPDHEVAICGDATRLSQALSNLINNAAKYTPDGGLIQIELTTDGHTALISVTDNGLGIPGDMLEHVFSMFTQVNRTLERAQGGLGIGLALVRSLVLLHGGTVRAASAGAGRGSRFTIELPLADLDRVDAPVSQRKETPATPVPGLRLLVVDDNLDAADALSMLLSLDGHEVRVEHAAEAALRAADAFYPHAIFCDIGMPGMSGLEFATSLRQNPRFSDTLLVAVTGWGAQEDQRRSRSAGFDAHLTKPVDMDGVSRLLAAVSGSR